MSRCEQDCTIKDWPHDGPCEVQQYFAAGHRNAGYSQCDGRYVARCGCGWETTRRTTYDRAQQALRDHLAQR